MLMVYLLYNIVGVYSGAIRVVSINLRKFLIIHSEITYL